MDRVTGTGSQPAHARDECRSAERANPAGGEAQTPRFVFGDHVRVHRGVFTGVEGKVLERCSDARLLIAVDLQQRGVSLEIDSTSIERADWPAHLHLAGT